MTRGGRGSTARPKSEAIGTPPPNAPIRGSVAIGSQSASATTEHPMVNSPRGNPQAPSDTPPSQAPTTTRKRPRKRKGKVSAGDEAHQDVDAGPVGEQLAIDQEEEQEQEVQPLVPVPVPVGGASSKVTHAQAPQAVPVQSPTDVESIPEVPAAAPVVTLSVNVTDSTAGTATQTGTETQTTLPTSTSRRRPRRKNKGPGASGTAEEEVEAQAAAADVISNASAQSPPEDKLPVPQAAANVVLPLVPPSEALQAVAAVESLAQPLESAHNVNVPPAVPVELPVSASADVPEPASQARNDNNAATASVPQSESATPATGANRRRRNKRKGNAAAEDTTGSLNSEAQLATSEEVPQPEPAAQADPEPLSVALAVEADDPGPQTMNDAAESVAPVATTTTTPKPRNRRKGKGKAEAVDNPPGGELPPATSHAPSPLASGGSQQDSNAGANAGPTPPRSQYQHYIPRLALREFASTEARAKDKRNPLVKVFSLRTLAITPTPVAKCYGHQNMYQDVSAADEMHIEKALSELERQASNIINRIKKAQLAGEPSVTMTRVERNIVRKFLFVMKYRNTLFFSKYSCSVEDYQHGDRTRVLKFMKKNGFTKPIQVWLQMLRTMMDIEIDVHENWIKKMMKTCFEDDAMWFWFNMQESFMAFCQPANPSEDEFIVSESAFGIHEGPTDVGMQSIAEEAQIESNKPARMPPASDAEFDLRQMAKYTRKGGFDSWYTEYHKMAPFSPKLLLVLRSNYLRDENSKKLLRNMAKTGAPGSHQWTQPSLFDHLTLEPAVPSYGMNMTVDRFKPSDLDTFTFKLHKLSHKDVTLFNSIILNEVKLNLTWHNDKAMKTTLEEYLAENELRLPMQLAMFIGTETINKVPEVERRVGLQTLATMLSEKKGGPASKVPVPTPASHVQGMEAFTKQLLANPAAQGYLKLGDSFNFIRDYFQASLVSSMRNMIADALPSGPHRRIYRNCVMRTKLDFFYTLPPAVIYWHVAIWRVVQKARQARARAGPWVYVSTDQIMSEDRDSGEIGAENAVAELAAKIPQQHLSKLMLQASFRKMLQDEHGPGQETLVEMDCLAIFGGLTSSFLIESTPLYDPHYNLALLDPYREEKPTNDELMRECLVRRNIKQAGYIEGRWGPEVDKFVWEWLYDPFDDIPIKTPKSREGGGKGKGAKR